MKNVVVSTEAYFFIKVDKSIELPDKVISKWQPNVKYHKL